MKESEKYVSPDIKVIQYVSEGFLCASGWADDSDDVELFF